MRGIGSIAAAVVLLAVGQAHAAAERVLVVYTETKRPALTEQWIVPSLVNLLGHFDCTPEVVPAGAYQPGKVDEHDAVILLGLDAEAALPEALLADVYDTERPVCWIGYGLDRMASRFSLGRYGFRTGVPRPGSEYARVVYRGQLLGRTETPLVPITVTHRAACKVLATAEGSGPPLAYAVRSGQFWYFADVPLMEVDERGSYLVLCDQLHEILDQRHPTRPTALLAVGDVTAETDAGALRKLVRYLQSERLPYALTVVPVLKDPAARVETALSSRRSLVGVVRGAQRAGAAVIAHGLTHQHTGRTGEDAEFWDMSRNRPPVGHSPSDTSRRMGESIAELARCGLYPLVWATPAGLASSADYAEMARTCSTVCERRMPSGLAPAPQVFPFVIERDSYGQRVIPDNLSPMRQGTADVESILEEVRCQSVVPDPWLTVTVAADSPPDAVKMLVAGMEELGFEFADLRRTSNWMKARSLEIHSEELAKPVVDLLPTGWDATILGPGKTDLTRFEDATSDGREDGVVRPGAILIAYPPGGRPREVFAFEGGPDELARRAVTVVARTAVIFAVAICVVFILIYLSQVALQRRT